MSRLNAMEPYAWLLLRVLFGIVMLTHGLPKLLGTAHGSMADPMSGATRLIADVLHLPFAPQLAMAAAVLEVAGGALLVAGWLVRPVALLMAAELVAICYVHREHFAWIDRGMEYPLVLLAMALVIATHGAGRWSVDARRA